MDLDTLRETLAQAAAAQYAAASSRQRLFDSLDEPDRALVAAYLIGGCDEATWRRAIGYTLACRAAENA